MVQVLTKEKRYKCVKCGKEKTKAQGTFYLRGITYCCNVCCGDPKKGDHKKKADNACEFC